MKFTQLRGSVHIAFSLFLALIIIGSLKHTQLSKVQSANKVFYPFFPFYFIHIAAYLHNQNRSPGHFFSTVMYHNILCSTASFTDHANPAVKSIVVLRIPKYKLLTYQNMPINVIEEYSVTFFELKNLKICHLIQS